MVKTSVERKILKISKKAKRAKKAVDLDRITRLQPTEEDIQISIFDWAKKTAVRLPALEVLYAVPNAGKRSKIHGGRMRAAGLRAGVPDLCLPVKAHGYGALYIELKRGRTDRVTPEQKAWINKLRTYGNLAVVCRSFEAAVGVLEAYVSWKPLT